jgi:hypothetical protein
MSLAQSFHRMGDQGAIFSQGTRVQPAFGAIAKIERNRKLTARIMNLNYGVDKIGSGLKWQETVSDPLKRDPAYLMQRWREQTSITGFARSRIRPAAPQQVTWKNDYWLVQRTRALNPQSIGPYTISSLPQQSILYRLSDAFSAFAQRG